MRYQSNLNDACADSKHRMLHMHDERTAADIRAVAVTRHNAQIFAELNARYPRCEQAVHIRYPQPGVIQGIASGFSMQRQRRLAGQHANLIGLTRSDDSHLAPHVSRLVHHILDILSISSACTRTKARQREIVINIVEHYLNWHLATNHLGVRLHLN